MEELKALCTEWLNAKQNEAACVAARIKIEERIITLTGKKDEGSETHMTDGFKVTVKAVINRKMDWDKWKEVKAKIPVELQPVKMKPELDDRGVKWLAENRPDLYALLPVEVKPGKTGIEVKAA